jgi:hypothetical protein
MQPSLRSNHLPAAPAEQQVLVHAKGVDDGQLIVQVGVERSQKFVAPHWAAAERGRYPSEAGADRLPVTPQPDAPSYGFPLMPTLRHEIRSAHPIPSRDVVCGPMSLSAEARFWRKRLDTMRRASLIDARLEGASQLDALMVFAAS